MTKVIAIDPGTSKCGMVLADLEHKIVYEAIVIQSNMLLNHIKKLCKTDDKIKFIIGNGTSSQKHIKTLSEYVSRIIVVEEKNSTYRAKEKYFEIFPLNGVKSFLPREIFLINKNLDALAALILMEDYYQCQFDLSNEVSVKTWLK